MNEVEADRTPDDGFKSDLALDEVSKLGATHGCDWPLVFSWEDQEWVTRRVIVRERTLRILRGINIAVIRDVAAPASQRRWDV
ncbi:hypothetical protein IMZ48_22065 [Candidatus Bathyarchaeota archaeon]|nr:hypothetical protein [Candidatus Bathyarchaeota archaeon]